MIIHNVEQRSDEWFSLRGKLPTASNFSKIITSKAQISSQFDKYAEQIATDTVANTFQNKAMTDGIIYEDTAFTQFEVETFLTVSKIGFITDDKKIAGCSPDGVIKDLTDEIVSGLEIKCVQPSVFEKYKTQNKCPTQYYPQVMGSIAICNVKSWYFCAYDFTNQLSFITEVERDEFWIERFWILIEKFNQKLSNLAEI